MGKIEVYETIRDGSQDKDLELTLSDKVKIARLVDSLGVPYIKIGWPFSNDIDRKVYPRLKEYGLNAKIAAFGSTRKINSTSEADDNLRAIVETETPVATIFGKSWTLHVEKQLRASLEQNLDAIYSSVLFLKKFHPEVIFDAEHFFDGFKADSNYALRCIDAAFDAGADRLILCDTNGGAFPWEIRETTKQVIEYYLKQNKKAKLGIHAHNDGGFGVANTIEFVNLSNNPRFEPYIVQVQGTFGGFGERIGNADLFQILGNLDIGRMGIPTDVDDNRTKLTDVFNEICDIVEVRPYVNTPFVGKNAGGHKAGVHADGKMKGASYDFYDLTRVGNKPSIVISNQSGTANIVSLAESFGYDIKKSDSRIKALLAEFKRMSDMGYRNGSLEAEQYLLVDECLGNSKMFFSITHHKVVDEDGLSTCELEGKVNGAHDKINTTVRGGPVDATYHAMQGLLSKKYSSIKGVELLHYWVKDIENGENLGAAAKVRVKVEFKYKKDGRNYYWENVGVSHDIIAASREVIEKGFRYHLLKHEK